MDYWGDERDGDCGSPYFFKNVEFLAKNRKVVV